MYKLIKQINTLRFSRSKVMGTQPHLNDLIPHHVHVYNVWNWPKLQFFFIEINVGMFSDSQTKVLTLHMWAIFWIVWAI